jgi:hypothetical protein
MTARDLAIRDAIWAAAAKYNPPDPAAERRAQLIEDVEWLLKSGEYPPRVAQRVGRTPGGLCKLLRRAGRPDLANPFEPYRPDRRRTA